MKNYTAVYRSKFTIARFYRYYRAFDQRRSYDAVWKIDRGILGRTFVLTLFERIIHFPWYREIGRSIPSSLVLLYWKDRFWDEICIWLQEDIAAKGRRLVDNDVKFHIDYVYIYMYICMYYIIKKIQSNVNVRTLISPYKTRCLIVRDDLKIEKKKKKQSHYCIIDLWWMSVSRVQCREEKLHWHDICHEGEKVWKSDDFDYSRWLGKHTKETANHQNILTIIQLLDHVLLSTNTATSV